MTMMTRICPICGKEFTITNGNQKYCSEECRIEGTRRTRQDWVDRTGYREKKREAMRRHRARISAEEAEKRAVEEKERREAHQRKMDQLRRENQEREKELADSGDPFARMRLSDRMSIEYWEAFRDYDLDYASQSGRTSSTTVNGISVHDDHFPEEVVKSIEERKIIMTRR